MRNVEAIHYFYGDGHCDRIFWFHHVWMWCEGMTRLTNKCLPRNRKQLLASQARCWNQWTAVGTIASYVKIWSNLVLFGWCIVFILSEAGANVVGGGCAGGWLLATTAGKPRKAGKAWWLAPAGVSTQASRDRNSLPQCRGKGRGTASGPPTHVWVPSCPQKTLTVQSSTFYSAFPVMLNQYKTTILNRIRPKAYRLEWRALDQNCKDGWQGAQLRFRGADVLLLGFHWPAQLAFPPQPSLTEMSFALCDLGK